MKAKNVLLLIALLSTTASAGHVAIPEEAKAARPSMSMVQAPMVEADLPKDEIGTHPISKTCNPADVFYDDWKTAQDALRKANVDFGTVGNLLVASVVDMIPGVSSCGVFGKAAWHVVLAPSIDSALDDLGATALVTGGQAAISLIPVPKTVIEAAGSRVYTYAQSATGTVVAAKAAQGSVEAMIEDLAKHVSPAVVASIRTQVQKGWSEEAQTEEEQLRKRAASAQIMVEKEAKMPWYKKAARKVGRKAKAFWRSTKKVIKDTIYATVDLIAPAYVKVRTMAVDTAQWVDAQIEKQPMAKMALQMT